MADVPRLPNDKQRLSVIGSTGSGKTVAALWHLSKRNIDTTPWLVMDFKGDDHINAIEGAQHVGLDFQLTPKSKGLYVVHPLPSEGKDVEALMWRVWQRGHCGMYLDEGYMADNEAFQAILTQGRSKRIPAITLTQRPVWCSRFVFSESQFIQLFDLADDRDKKTVTSFIKGDTTESLPEFNSYYYDVAKKKLWRFKPVPEVEKIIGEIDAKLTTNRRHIFV